VTWLRPNNPQVLEPPGQTLTFPTLAAESSSDDSEAEVAGLGGVRHLLS
jgi:hypothetical protein